MRASGYRPTRVRPYRLAFPRDAELSPGTRNVPATFVAVIWMRDGKKWELQTDLALTQVPKSSELGEKDDLIPADLTVLPSNDHSAEPRFVLLWSETAAAGEQRRLLVDLEAQAFEMMRGTLVKQGFVAQTTLSVRTDQTGQRRYAGIWSNQGAVSEARLGYVGFELVDQPQWDVAAAAVPPVKLADPLQKFRTQLTQLEKLPAEKQGDPQVCEMRATANYHLGNLEPVLADLDLLIGKEIITPTILQYRTLTLARLGKAEEAKAALTKFLAASSSDSFKAYVQIQVPAWLGDFEAASQQLELAAAANF